MTSRILVVLAIIALTPGAHARDRLELRARPAFAFAPADLQLEFSIVPDAGNRALEVVAESYDFYRSSRIELDGERAQRVASVRYHSLPAGDYGVRGALIDAEGHERAVVEKQVTVMTAGGEH